MITLGIDSGTQSTKTIAHDLETERSWPVPNNPLAL
jgi:sugar (pentulose or hexulose) kinase